MYCKKCGNFIDNMNFCQKCGTKREGYVSNVQTNNQQQVNQPVANSNNVSNNSVPKSKNKTGCIIAVIISLLMLIGLIVLLIFGIRMVFNSFLNEDEIIHNEDNVLGDEGLYDDGSSEKIDLITDFDNYEVEIIMELVAGGVTTEMNSVGVVDEKNQHEYLEVTTTTMGGFVSIKNKLYHDYTTGYTYMTEPLQNDVWIKQKSASQTIDLSKLVDKLINMEDVRKISDDQYQVKMSPDDIMGLVSSGNVDTSSLMGDIYADVYMEDGYVVKIEYDFTQLMSVFDSFITTMNISNYNNAGDVEIPQEVIDNAIEK